MAYQNSESKSPGQTRGKEMNEDFRRASSESAKKTSLRRSSRISQFTNDATGQNHLEARDTQDASVMESNLHAMTWQRDDRDYNASSDHEAGAHLRPNASENLLHCSKGAPSTTATEFKTVSLSKLAGQKEHTDSSREFVDLKTLAFGASAKKEKPRPSTSPRVVRKRKAAPTLGSLSLRNMEKRAAGEPEESPLSFPKRNFAVTLQNMLNSTSIPAAAIAWHESGKAFAFDQNSKELESILSHFYGKEIKPSSFRRQLNSYGFSKHSQGEYIGNFVHEDFTRNASEESLRKKIVRCQKGSSKTGTTRGKSVPQRRPRSSVSRSARSRGKSIPEKPRMGSRVQESPVALGRIPRSTMEPFPYSKPEFLTRENAEELLTLSSPFFENSSSVGNHSIHDVSRVSTLSCDPRRQPEESQDIMLLPMIETPRKCYTSPGYSRKFNAKTGDFSHVSVESPSLKVGDTFSTPSTSTLETEGLLELLTQQLINSTDSSWKCNPSSKEELCSGAFCEMSPPWSTDQTCYYGVDGGRRQLVVPRPQSGHPKVTSSVPQQCFENRWVVPFTEMSPIVAVASKRTSCASSTTSTATIETTIPIEVRLPFSFNQYDRNSEF